MTDAVSVDEHRLTVHTALINGSVFVYVPKM